MSEKGDVPGLRQDGMRVEVDFEADTGPFAAAAAEVENLTLGRLLDRFENAVRREADLDNLHHEAIADLARARRAVTERVAGWKARA